MNNNQKTFLFCTALVIFAVATRILSLENGWMNFASMGAVSLFSGVVFKNKPYAMLLPLVAFLISDFYVEYFTNNPGFYGVSQYFVYGSMLLVVLLGSTMKRVSVLNVAGYAIGSSLLFFLLTNFGTWFSGFFPTPTMPAFYPLNAAGLLACLEMGIPFYRNTFLSDLLFSGVLFGAYALFQSFYKTNVLSSEKTWSDTVGKI